MAAHHGGPGSKVQEVGLMVLLVIFTPVFLMGVAVGGFELVVVVWHPEHKQAGAAVVGVALSLAVLLMTCPWMALFNDHGSEAGALRPIKKDRTNDRDAY